MNMNNELGKIWKEEVTEGTILASALRCWGKAQKKIWVSHPQNWELKPWLPICKADISTNYSEHYNSLRKHEQISTVIFCVSMDQCCVSHIIYCLCTNIRVK